MVAPEWVVQHPHSARERVLPIAPMGSLRTHGWHEGAVLYRAVPEVGRVAQRDRASAFEAEGCRFEPCRGRQTERPKKKRPGGRWVSKQFRALRPTMAAIGHELSAGLDD